MVLKTIRLHRPFPETPRWGARIVRASQILPQTGVFFRFFRESRGDEVSDNGGSGSILMTTKYIGIEEATVVGRQCIALLGGWEGYRIGTVGRRQVTES